MSPSLFLIPVTLGDTPIDRTLPAYNKGIILSLRHFIVENVRSARRFLKQTEPAIAIDALTFYTLNQHTTYEELSGFLHPLQQGESMGLLSEAGCPAIADPGADVVAMAQQKGIPVIPLVGPSSILLALMASGLNGQNFAFHGYLPIDSNLRIKTLKQLEQQIYANRQTQLFIETPYRNQKMLQDILNTCRADVKLCIAVDITLPTEAIRTRRVIDWHKNIPELSKRLCIFALGI
ncbi:MAG: SAM-dependent methyltransferase [Dysgonamonadaceae bacterium]|jgi:16S rRNA (cytidine1402-2'-O)-methyltransferase|nr:SAM-dependent methyltransferase [Dysgonamonadaceae bacterium]